MLNKNQLTEFQNAAITRMYECDETILYAGMGFGKSVTYLTAISELMNDFVVGRALIIAPLKPCLHVWSSEHKGWSHLCDLDVAVATGTPDQRHAAIMSNAQVVVLNIENIVWFVNRYGKSHNFDALCIDELSKFGESGNKSVKALRRITKTFKHRVGLTGTPVHEGFDKLFAQALMIDAGARLGTNKALFMRQYFYPTDYNEYNWELSEGMDKVIMSKLSDLIHIAPDYTSELPPLNEQAVYVELDSDSMALYKLFCKEFAIDVSGDVVISADNAAVLSGKLEQFANGFLYDESKNVWSIHIEKIYALEQLLVGLKGEQCAVFYQYQADKDAIVKLFKQMGVSYSTLDEKGGIDKFLSGQVQCVLLHPKCLHPDTEVLTEFRGWVKIVDVRHDERVFDGVEFVNHLGCHCSGVQPVIEVFGIEMTDQHKLLVDNKWVEAKHVQDIENARQKALYKYEGDDSSISSMFELLERERDIGTERPKSKQVKTEILRQMLKRLFPQYVRYKDMAYMEKYERPYIKEKLQELQTLWWSWVNNCKIVARFSEFLCGYVRNIRGWFDFGTYRQWQGLLQGELQMGEQFGTAIEQEKQQKNYLQRSINTLSRIMSFNRHKSWGDNAKTEQRNVSRASGERLHEVNVPKKQKVSKVYDLVECGSRNRFLIRNSKGEMFISHNSAGHGLNLQKGGACNLVCYSPIWSNDQRKQLIARLWRRGQTNPVTVYDIVAKDTVDELKVVRVADKEEYDRLFKQHLESIKKPYS